MRSLSAQQLTGLGLCEAGEGLYRQTRKSIPGINPCNMGTIGTDRADIVGSIQRTNPCNMGTIGTDSTDIVGPIQATTGISTCHYY